MSARLTTAIEIASSANAILQRVQAFDQKDLQNKQDWDMAAHMGINPMLLALSMELALKAWYVFDYDKTNFKRIHDLSKLFKKLKPESQYKLDSEFKQSVSLLHPKLLYVDYGIRNVLQHHENDFVDWRYSFDRKKPCSLIKACSPQP